MIRISFDLGVPAFGHAFKCANTIDSLIGAGGQVGSAALNAAAQRYAADRNYNAQVETNEANRRNVQATNEANSAQVMYANNMNRLIAQETNAANERLWKMQDESAWKKWYAQNAYDSPAAQAARLRAAGLNPNMILGQGSFSEAGSIATPSASPAVTGEGFQPALNETFQAVAPHMDSVDYGQVGAAIMSSASQYYKMQMDKIDLKYKDMDWQKRLAYLQAQTDEALGRKDLSKAQLQGLMQQQKFLDQSWNDLLDQNHFNALLTQSSIKVAEENALKLAADRAQTELQTKFMEKKIPLDLQQQRAMIKSIFTDISLKQSQKKLTDQQVNTEIFNGLKTWFEANSVRDANERAKELQPFVKDSYDSQFMHTQADIMRMRYEQSPGFNHVINLREGDANDPVSKRAADAYATKSQSYYNRHHSRR